MKLEVKNFFKKVITVSLSLLLVMSMLPISPVLAFDTLNEENTDVANNSEHLRVERVDVASGENIVKAKTDLVYNEKFQPLFDLQLNNSGNEISWTQLEGPSVKGPSNQIPQGKDAGNYVFNVTVKDNGGNAILTDYKVSVTIAKAPLSVEYIKVQGRSDAVKSDGKLKPAVTVTGLSLGQSKGVKLLYKIGKKDENKIPDVNTQEGWSEELPLVKESGKYVVVTKAVKVTPTGNQDNNYEEVKVEVSKPEKLKSSAELFNVSLEAEKKKGDNLKVERLNEKDENVIAAALEGDAADVNAGEEGETSEKDKTKLCDKASNEFKFEASEITKIISAKDLTLSNLRAIVTDAQDKGQITYSYQVVFPDGFDVQKKDEVNEAIKNCININSKGKITVRGDRLWQLSKNIKEDIGSNQLTLKVKAHKAEYKLKKFFGPVIKTFLEADACYDLHLKLAAAPSNLTEMLEIKGKKGANQYETWHENNWYTSVQVGITENYKGRFWMLSERSRYKELERFEDNGTDIRTIYLYDEDGGEVFPAEIKGVYIDKTSPKIEEAGYIDPIYSVKNDDEPAPSVVYYGGEDKKKIQVKFKLEKYKEAAPITELCWRLKDEKGKEITGAIKDVANLSQDTNGFCIATIDCGQIQGKLSLKVKNAAGKESDELTLDSIVIYDTVSPKITFTKVINYDENRQESPFISEKDNDNNVYYGNGAFLQYQITIDEANFYKDDVKITINGVPIEETGLKINWTDKENTHIGTIEIRDDGRYSIDVKYENDRSGNKTEKENVVLNPTIVMDKVPPKIEVSGVGDKDHLRKSEHKKGVTYNYYYYDKNKEAALTITDENFVAASTGVWLKKDNGSEQLVKVDWIRDSSMPNQHKAILQLDGGGEYEIKIESTDKVGNKSSYPADDETNVYVIDSKAPEITVNYKNSAGNDITNSITSGEKKYFTEKITAEINVKEKYFNPESVKLYIEGTDAAGNEIDENKNNQLKWLRKNNEKDDYTYVGTVEFDKDANYSFAFSCEDLAGNGAKYGPNEFVIDQASPDNLKVSYSESLLDTTVSGELFSFYNSKVEVSLTADDATSGVDSFEYSYINVTGVSRVNGELYNQKIYPTSIVKNGKKAQANFEIPRNILTRGTQFNGHIEFVAIDKAGNKSVLKKDLTRIVVDNIAPVSSVSYNAAISNYGNVSYYDGSINGMITIDEANFYPEDVKVLVSKDGGYATRIDPRWENVSVDIHKGYFQLNGDGDYIVTVQYVDRSRNEMKTYVSKKMVIDTKITKPSLTINGSSKKDEGGTYGGKAQVGFHFEDKNLENSQIKLVRIRHNKTEDVTGKFIKTNLTLQGGSGSFDIPEKEENDGIYVLSVSIKDRANHSAESKMQFTINRYGSLYEYGALVSELMKDGGQYVRRKSNEKSPITEDLIIYEYNPSPLLNGGGKVFITRDGEKIDVAYDVALIAAPAGSGWYKYAYRIKKSNFLKDGRYKISIDSKYVTNDIGTKESTNSQANSFNYRNENVKNDIKFVVDTKAPELRNVTNLDKAIVDSNKLEVRYTVVDVGGLKSVEVFVDGKPVEKVTDFKGDPFSYDGAFFIHQKNRPQHVRFILTDMAGNVTDTDSKNFKTDGLYTFNRHITVTTNAIVRWYANKALFWGVIGGGLFFLMLIIVLVARRKRK